VLQETLNRLHLDPPFIPLLLLPFSSYRFRRNSCVLYTVEVGLNVPGLKKSLPGTPFPAWRQIVLPLT